MLCLFYSVVVVQHFQPRFVWNAVNRLSRFVPLITSYNLYETLSDISDDIIVVYHDLLFCQLFHCTKQKEILNENAWQIEKQDIE